MLRNNKFYWISGLCISFILVFLFLNIPAHAAVLDSGYIPPYFESAPTIETMALDELIAMRTTLDFLVYTVLPVAVAILLLWLGCRWFYDTFIRPVL